MVLSSTQVVVDFIKDLSPNTNPYPALSTLILSLLQPPPTENWVRSLRRACLVAFLIMFLQSCYLIHIRVKLKSFRTVGIDELGLLRIDFNSVAALAVLGYTLLSMVFLILGEAIDHGFLVVSPWLMLYGCKFLIPLSASTSFLWVCACHSASLKWKPRKSVADFGKKKMPRIIQLMMHLVLAFLLIFPAALVIYYFSKANAIYLFIVRALVPILKSLKKDELSYSPQSDVKGHLLLTLAPALSLEALHVSFAENIRMGVQVNLYYIVILSLAYIPLLSSTIRGVYLHARAEVHMTKSIVFSNVEETRRFQEMSSTTRKKRRLLVLSALLLLFNTWVHLPSLIWMGIHTSNEFFRESTWMNVSLLTLHIPFTFTGIITMSVLIHAARVQLPSANNFSEAFSLKNTLASIFRKPETSSSTEMQPSSRSNNAFFKKGDVWHNRDEGEQVSERENPLWSSSLQTQTIVHQ